MDLTPRLLTDPPGRLALVGTVIGFLVFASHCGLDADSRAPAQTAGAQAAQGGSTSDAEPATKGKLRSAASRGPSGVTVDKRRGGPMPIGAEAIRAKSLEVYRAACLECHDHDGGGGVARDLFPKVPDFRDPAWQSSRSDGDLTRSILEGKGKSMPRMKSKLGSVEPLQMVAFIRAFRGGKQVVEDEPEPAGVSLEAPVESKLRSRRFPAMAEGVVPGRAAAEKDFRRFCAQCHEHSGQGAAMRANLPAIPDFTRREWQTSRTDARLRISILEGKGKDMPSFRGKIEPDRARVLVDYVRTLGPPRAKEMPSGWQGFDEELQKLEREFESLRNRARKLSSDPPQESCASRRGRPTVVTALVNQARAIDGGSDPARGGGMLVEPPFGFALGVVPSGGGWNGPRPGGGAGAGPVGSGVLLSSAMGCEKTNRLGEGPTGGVGGPTAFQRLRKKMICRYSLPVKYAWSRMWATAT